VKATLAREQTTERGGRGEAPRAAAGRAWRTARVGDLCDLINGDPFKPTDWSKTGTRIIRIQNLNDATKPFNHWAGPVGRLVQVKDGDVLLAWSGTPGTSFGAHIWRRGDGVLNQHIFRVDITSDQVTPEWFVRAVNFCLQALINRAHGAVGLAHVTKGEVQALEIPLPPPAEQERIAGRLTEQLAAVERARGAAQSRLDAAKSLADAFLREVFEGPEASGWETVTIRDLAQSCSGATPPRGHKSYFGGGIPWVKTGELQDGPVCADGLTEETVSPEALRDCSLPLLPPGTLLVAMYGQGKTRGRTGLLMREGTTNQACFAILPRPDVFDSGLLQYWFRANYSRLRALTEARGGNQPNLNGVLLRELEVTLPPLPDQRRIAADLAARLAGAERLAEGIRAELAAIEALPAALLREAIGGNDHGR
jgi:type I restriction enzyme S subunit